MKRNYWATVGLLSVAVVWGATFVLMKDAIERQPLYDFLAVRFTIATIIMICVRPMILKTLNGELLKKGIVLGILLSGGYITQTIGLSMTTAAITGFITGLYVVLTPILALIILGQKVSIKVVWGVALATIGLALISFTGFNIEIGQIWVMLCALFFAAHLVGLGAWSKNLDSYALTVVQLFVVSCASWIGAAPDGIQMPVDFDGWFAIVFTAIFATALAFLLQTWAQSHMDASRVAIILTGEVVFAAVISVAVGQEILQFKTILGGLIMLAAMLLVEWPSRKIKTKI